MNSFLQEVITQGDYLKKTAAYYRSEGAEAMRQITDLFHEKNESCGSHGYGQLAVCDGYGAELSDRPWDPCAFL